MNPLEKILIALLLLVVTVLMMLAFGSGDVCAEDKIECRYKGGYGGAYWDVALDGKYVYAANAQGLSIINVSNLSEPEEIGYTHTSGHAYGVAISGDYAYISDGINGLVIMDISVKKNPKQTAIYNTGNAMDVTVTGNYAFVADYDNGLVIVDVSDASNPEKVGDYNTSGNAFDVAVSGDYVYMADSDGLAILSTSDLNNPKKIGNYDLPESILGIAVSGNYVYVANAKNGLVIVDVTDKSHPQMAGRYNTSDHPFDVTVSGDYAYVADNYNGLLIIDISDKSDPREVSFLNTSRGGAYKVIVSGDYACVNELYHGFIMVDISEKSNPQIVSEYDPSCSAINVEVSGNYAYIAEFDHELAIVDITDKINPKKIGSYDFSGDIFEVAVSDNYVYIANLENGLEIIDVHDKSDPQMVGSYNTSGNSHGVAIAGNYAYVTDAFNGLVIVDITDKTNPQKVGSYNTSGYATNVVVFDDYAYVTLWDNGLVIVNVYDKSDPQYIGAYNTSGNAFDVTVNGDYAYVADFYNGLVIIDITDKTNPQKIGWYDTSQCAISLDVDAYYAYIADDWNDLVIVDISDKANPIYAGHYGGYERTWDVVVRDHYAYVADFHGGFHIVEIKKTDSNLVEVTNTDNCLKIRQNHGISSDVIQCVPDSWVLIIIDTHEDTIEQDGFIWWEVEDVTTGVRGWVAKEFLNQGDQTELSKKVQSLTTPEERTPVILEAMNHYYQNENSKSSLYNSNDGNNDFTVLQKNNFPVELILAIAAQESGGIYEYDNEITPPGHGYGIMQITWPGNLGWGSNLKCYSEDCEWYTNTPQGIYANIKDGLRVLQWAFSNEYAYKNGDETAYVSPDGLSFSNNDVRIIIAVWKYNGGGDPHYLQRVAEKLERNEGKSTVENDFGVSYDNLDLTNDLVEKLKYAQNHKIEMFIYSPVRPKIYDSQSSITGLVNSEIKEEIPYSCYNNTRIIIFFTNDTYNYEVLGMDEGTYGLLITSVKNGTLINFTAIDIPTNKCEVHTYSIDWNALSRGEKAVTITIDREGDGKVDYTIRSNGTFTKEKYDAAIKDDGDGKNGESDSLLFVQIGPLPLIGYIGIAAVIAMVGFVPVKKKAKGKTEAGMTPATVPSQQPQPPQLPPAQPPQQPPPQQYDQPQQYQQYAQAPQVPSQEIRMQADGTWVCSQCDNKIPGKFIFCTECGFKKGDGKTGG